ncbi:hypothetical protein GCM10010985_61110 [Caballeronia grimmiae]|uniref:Uncharacterized protein n=1 Tax=Caballeronia grimmiae TaxID=1071679 RepID=A0ABQ1SBJ6_9BURK|nr:hypothetical protein GCM10010985_61110 [Caballeronia grimmiae]
MRVELHDLGTVEIEIEKCSSGHGVTVSQRFAAKDGTTSTSFTCTCYESNGKSYSKTITCPDGNNTCDCSTPSSPSPSCG